MVNPGGGRAPPICCPATTRGPGSGNCPGSTAWWSGYWAPTCSRCAST